MSLRKKARLSREIVTSTFFSHLWEIRSGKQDQCSAVEGRGQWMLQCSEFQDWFKSVGGSTLWCYGIPGGGKTVLTTHSEFDLLSSIAWQLANYYVGIPPALREFRDKNAGKKGNPTSKEWITLIKELSRSFPKTYIFIDALDECPKRNRDEFIRSLKDLEESTLLFLSSRPIVLPVQFSKIQRVEISAAASDMKTYLKTEINSRSRLSKFAARDPNLESDIINSLIRNAAGINTVQIPQP
ncbi:predicted protein [Aspergillus terreus NIH2624]|uniref:Nephrocystin 3-like N-terminal domain-containing protein n=1 Tax=Aspergillus terreus (strain NIH 2624 / FGSC A1156) TaxID=341663 RepID=Q0CBQ0_ASPTN|nr:uncharacterized protein ATEG_08884 [Aspergillus terreus NIH2624]EAU31016.1 predicted protein [Aspergillus terreus NIH2624]